MEYAARVQRLGCVNWEPSSSSLLSCTLFKTWGVISLGRLLHSDVANSMSMWKDYKFVDMMLLFFCVCWQVCCLQRWWKANKSRLFSPALCWKICETLGCLQEVQWMSAVVDNPCEKIVGRKCFVCLENIINLDCFPGIRAFRLLV